MAGESVFLDAVALVALVNKSDSLHARTVSVYARLSAHRSSRVIGS